MTENQFEKAEELLKKYSQEVLANQHAHDFKQYIYKEYNTKFTISKDSVTFSKNVLIPEYNIDLTIYDCKVNVKWGRPDDVIYGRKGNKFAKIRNLVTRGCMIVEIKHLKERETPLSENIIEEEAEVEEDGENAGGNKKKNKGKKAKRANYDEKKYEVEKTEFRLFNGFCKFSGMSDNDDDDMFKLRDQLKKKEGNKKKKKEEETEEAETPETPTSSKNGNKKDVFFIQPYVKATHMFVSMKENGKAGHFGAMKINLKNDKTLTLFIGGSKNVHIVWRNRGDLKHVNKIDVLHARVGHAMMNLLDRLEEGKRQKLVQTLINSGMLANFEIMLTDDQHVVDYACNEDLPRFLALTGRRIDTDQYQKECGKCFPPHLGMAWAKHYGMECSPHKDRIPFSENELAKLIGEVRHDTHSEGSVIYFMDSETRTIGLWKLKTIWYIMLRAIREKLVKLPPDFDKRVKKRFKDIKKWLNLTDNEVNSWRYFAHKLYCFMKAAAAKKQVDPSNMRPTYAIKVAEFMKQHRPPANIDDEISKIDSAE